MSLQLYFRFSLKPIVAVEVSVADGFCHMLALDVFCSLQVGNRAAHLQDSVVCTGRKVQPAHGRAQLLHTRIVEHGILLKKRGGHLRVAVNAFVTFEALLLNLAYQQHTLTYDLGRLTLR